MRLSQLRSHRGSTGPIHRRIGRRIVALSALILATVAVQSPAVATNGCDLTGEGTDATPYLVTNAADLAKVGIGDCEISASYLQTVDILQPAPASGHSNHLPIGWTSNHPAKYDGTWILFYGAERHAREHTPR